MTTTEHKLPKRRHKGLRLDPTPGKVRYSGRWLGALAAGGLLAGLGVLAGGWPAAAALGVAGGAGLAYAFFYEPRQPRLEHITLHIPDLPPALDGLRIGQISDMHLGMRYTLENSLWAAHQMALQQPDLLVLTGDFVSYEEAISQLPAVLRELPQAPLGCFAVAGNHDYWEGIETIQAALEAAGIRLLINQHALVTAHGEQMLIAGLDDLWDGRPDMGRTLAGAPQAPLRLLLAHCPDHADEACEHQFDLQLSGHTHGGHIHLPTLGSFCLPRHGWRYAIGHYQVGPTQLYVSRGIGGMPLRFGCPPEATIFTLRAGRGGGK
ncbi:MAG: metallophosphoesterase [Candidatus Viridilinea halotolerans]|uniref:Metallophosphoesterase n=1 Tax=Candidatus Viridilinea halotolerans TaxID=2491704 RepID=A0A426TYK6_9CHLR|nr:MAG: metallophosphoesterase [Candidatus Viridilinea halotolerans]